MSCSFIAQAADIAPNYKYSHIKFKIHQALLAKSRSPKVLGGLTCHIQNPRCPYKIVDLAKPIRLAIPEMIVSIDIQAFLGSPPPAKLKLNREIAHLIVRWLRKPFDIVLRGSRYLSQIAKMQRRNIPGLFLELSWSLAEWHMTGPLLWLNESPDNWYR